MRLSRATAFPPLLPVMTRGILYSIAAIVWRAIRARAWISFFKANASSEQAPCFRAFLFRFGASPPAPCIRHTLAPLTAGARHCSPLLFDWAWHLNARCTIMAFSASSARLFLSCSERLKTDAAPVIDHLLWFCPSPQKYFVRHFNVVRDKDLFVTL